MAIEKLKGQVANQEDYIQELEKKVEELQAKNKELEEKLKPKIIPTSNKIVVDDWVKRTYEQKDGYKWVNTGTDNITWTSSSGSTTFNYNSTITPIFKS